jgi:hypothetical protein
MRLSGIERAPGWQVVWSAAVIALVMAAVTRAEAGVRKSTVAKTYGQVAIAQQQSQKPIRLRYFGGPKSMMSPE